MVMELVTGFSIIKYRHFLDVYITELYCCSIKGWNDHRARHITLNVCIYYAHL